jgi:hypothetical protein
MRVACVHVPRFAADFERQRRNDLTTRLVHAAYATPDCRGHSVEAGARTNLVRRWQPLQPVAAEGQVKGGGDTLVYRRFLLAP